MNHVFLKRTLASLLGFGLFSSAALAGGYGGSSAPCSPIAPQEAQAFLAYADNYQDGNFKVRHTESAGSDVSINGYGESANGYGSSETEISGKGVTSWKRSVQRADGSATNGAGSANGFSATFLKVRTADGKYYMFKGLASTSASAGPGGSTSSQYGLARSVGGQVNR